MTALLATAAAALVVLAPLYLGLAALLELADGIPTEDAP